MVANAQLAHRPIIYCNDGFCELFGYVRAQIIQRPATLDFLYGPFTSPSSIRSLRAALAGVSERALEILLYRREGTKFDCRVFVAPVKNESGDVIMFIVSCEDSTEPSVDRGIFRTHICVACVGASTPVDECVSHCREARILVEGFGFVDDCLLLGLASGAFSGRTGRSLQPSAHGLRVRNAGARGPRRCSARADLIASARAAEPERVGPGPLLHGPLAAADGAFHSWHCGRVRHAGLLAQSEPPARPPRPPPRAALLSARGARRQRRRGRRSQAAHRSLEQFAALRQSQEASNY